MNYCCKILSVEYQLKLKFDSGILTLIYNNYPIIMSGSNYIDWNKYIPSSKKRMVYVPKRRTCSVVAGIQECGICYEEAYYSKNILKRHHPNFPQMSLFRCGHGMCVNCVSRVLDVGEFKCPYCRDEGSSIVKCPEYRYDGSDLVKSFYPNEVKCEQNTLEDYLYEWRDNIERVLATKDEFIELHNQIVSDYKKARKVRLEKDRKAKKVHLQKTVRRKSRKKAMCGICKRDTFTSEKQLVIHMSKKHKTSSKM